MTKRRLRKISEKNVPRQKFTLLTQLIILNYLITSLTFRWASFSSGRKSFCSPLKTYEYNGNDKVFSEINVSFVFQEVFRAAN